MWERAFAEGSESERKECDDQVKTSYQVWECWWVIIIVNGSLRQFGEWGEWVKVVQGNENAHTRHFLPIDAFVSVHPKSRPVSISLSRWSIKQTSCVRAASRFTLPLPPCHASRAAPRFLSRVLRRTIPEGAARMRYARDGERRRVVKRNLAKFVRKSLKLRNRKWKTVIEIVEVWRKGNMDYGIGVLVERGLEESKFFLLMIWDWANLANEADTWLFIE